jgi:subtilisin family serine protease
LAQVVVNNSWGGPRDSAIDDAITTAAQSNENLIFVVAAGNDNAE